jgi:hypothetical protein
MDYSATSSRGISMSDKVGIFIPDTTYGQNPDEGLWKEASARFKAKLEAEFETTFEESDIGPGFDIPAYVAYVALALPFLHMALEVFFRGEEINKNLSAWSDIVRRLNPFRRRRAVFDRDAAAFVAYGQIAKKLGRTPSAIRLVGYRTISWSEETDTTLEIVGISAAPATFSLGMLDHAFQIEADGRAFRVYVKGDGTLKLIAVAHPEKRSAERVVSRRRRKKSQELAKATAKLQRGRKHSSRKRPSRAKT